MVQPLLSSSLTLRVGPLYLLYRHYYTSLRESHGSAKLSYSCHNLIYISLAEFSFPRSYFRGHYADNVSHVDQLRSVPTAASNVLHEILLKPYFIGKSIGGLLVCSMAQDIRHQPAFWAVAACEVAQSSSRRSTGPSRSI